jgi:Uma2 family endonuclease
MQEYLDNGAQLGWLIDPLRRCVCVYRPSAQVEQLDNPPSLSGDPELLGFVLELTNIWEPPF